MMSMLRETRKMLREEMYCFCFVDINRGSKEAPLIQLPKSLTHGFVPTAF